MERRSFQTPVGEVWLSGETAAFDGDRPVVLCLLGFAAPPNRFYPLQGFLPEAAVLIGQLPGNHCPPLAACSVGAFAHAYGHVAATALGGRPVLAFGESLGGLVALAMDTPGLRRLVLDPPFRAPTDALFVDQCRGLLRQRPDQAELALALLGVGPDSLEDRDFTHLIGRAARVVIGSHTAPLKPGASQSVVGDAERAMLLRAPEVWLTVVEEAGHVLAAIAHDLVLGILRRMVAEMTLARASRSAE